MLVDMESKAFREILYMGPFAGRNPPRPGAKPSRSSLRMMIAQLRSGISRGGWVRCSLGKSHSAAEEAALMAEGEAINSHTRGQGTSRGFPSLFPSLHVVLEQKSLAPPHSTMPASPGKGASPPSSASLRPWRRKAGISHKVRGNGTAPGQALPSPRSRGAPTFPLAGDVAASGDIAAQPGLASGLLPQEGSLGEDRRRTGTGEQSAESWRGGHCGGHRGRARARVPAGSG